jgi:hypothetical protein
LQTHIAEDGIARTDNLTHQGRWLVAETLPAFSRCRYPTRALFGHEMKPFRGKSNQRVE